MENFNFFFYLKIKILYVICLYKFFNIFNKKQQLSINFFPFFTIFLLNCFKIFQFHIFNTFIF